MKTYCLLFILILIALQVVAQEMSKHSLTVNGGVGVGNAEGKEKNDYVIFQSSKPGFTGNAGLLYGYHFNKYVSIHSGIGYASNAIRGIGGYWESENSHIHNLEVPIHIRTRLSKNQWAAYLQAGLAYSYTFKYNSNLDYGNAIIPAIEINPFRNYLEHNVILNLGVGCEYALTQRTILFGGVYYKRMLSRTALFDSMYLPLSLWSAGTEVGFRFHLGSKA